MEHHFDGGGAGALDDVAAGGKAPKRKASTGGFGALLHGTFGDVSVSATGCDPDVLSSFAALRSSDGALTLMVISKALSGSTPLTVNLAGFRAGSAAQLWRLDGGNSIQRADDVSLAGGTFSRAVPAQSITLFVVPGRVRLRAKGPRLAAPSSLAPVEAAVP